MIRAVSIASLALILFIGSSRAEVEIAKSGGGGGGGGDGYSQQYHYSSYPQHGGHGGTYAGISIDVGTGIFLALGAIVVLAVLSAVLGSLKGHGDSGWGASGGGSAGGAAGGAGGYRSIDAANIAEKVLNGIERVYEVYNKSV